MDLTIAYSKSFFLAIFIQGIPNRVLLFENKNFLQFVTCRQTPEKNLCIELISKNYSQPFGTYSLFKITFSRISKGITFIFLKTVYNEHQYFGE